ncbi:hypothetical protein KAR91_45860 [Candidatus Pacearchaeota archaeon]|nr:hypothetical protein [Candidatus Pacearchaeota archaeon]
MDLTDEIDPRELIKELEAMSLEVFDNSIYLRVRKLISILKTPRGKPVKSEEE